MCVFLDSCQLLSRVTLEAINLKVSRRLQLVQRQCGLFSFKVLNRQVTDRVSSIALQCRLHELVRCLRFMLAVCPDAIYQYDQPVIKMRF